MNKYLFDENEISKELITLLSVFNASKKNNILLTTKSNDNLIAVFLVELGIIQENLITTAIKLRIIDDQFKKHNKISSFSSVVGKLKEGRKKSENLDLRKSCNKIVHAAKFSPKKHKQYYIPEIILEGIEGKVKWKAKIDINKYVCNGLSLIKQYDEDWDISATE